MTNKQLSSEEKKIIEDKGTEAPFSGKYDDFYIEGVYTCKRCGSELYRSDDKVDAKCGWPSFDDEVEGAVKRSLDEDRVRTELTCATCDAHLGHLFEGEGMTDKNVRHCVNSLSLGFNSLKKNDE